MTKRLSPDDKKMARYTRENERQAREQETTLSGIPRVEGPAPETPQQDVRNALTLLIASGDMQGNSPKGVHLSADDFQMITARLWVAVRQLEARQPVTPLPRLQVIRGDLERLAGQLGKCIREGSQRWTLENILVDLLAVAGNLHTLEKQL